MALQMRVTTHWKASRVRTEAMTVNTRGRDAKRDSGTPGFKFGRRAGVAAMGLVGAVALAGCSTTAIDDWKRAGLPEPVTEQGPIVESFWVGSWIAAMIVGVLVWGLMFWAFIAYRRRKNAEIPVQTRYHMPIEALWTIAPLIMVMGIFYFAARDEAELTNVSNTEQQTINVVGFRWSWTFNYVNEDTYDVGEPAYPPNATQGEAPRQPVPPDNESAVPTLWLPVNEKVKFELTSPDVIHSFWVPNFLFKLDVVPGRTNVFEATPNKIGTYAGKCAELCGVDHSRMLFQVKVVTQAEFDAHMEELRKRGQSGQLDTGRTTDRAQAV